jgi:GNT-I family
MRRPRVGRWRRVLLVGALALAVFNVTRLYGLIAMPTSSFSGQKPSLSPSSLEAEEDGVTRDAVYSPKTTSGSPSSPSPPESSSSSFEERGREEGEDGYKFLPDAAARELIPIVVVSCKREQYLRRMLTKLVSVLETLPETSESGLTVLAGKKNQKKPSARRRRPKTKGEDDGSEEDSQALSELERALAESPGVGADRFPVFISRDCDSEAVRAVVEEYEGRYGANCGSARGGVCVGTWRQPDRSPVQSYAGIARHFGFILNKAFGTSPGDAAPISLGPSLSVPYFEQVILLEEDLEVAPDFFHYFAATLPLLRDPGERLLAVSAWADNGAARFVSDPLVLHRSDFFPGLGWMITRRTWMANDGHLRRTWPLSFWDDWLRDPPQRRGRMCIRPEISRTFTFGENGVSKGQFFREHLSTIKLNDVPVDWLGDPDARKVIAGLQRERFDPAFAEQVRRAVVLPSWHDVTQFIRQHDKRAEASAEPQAPLEVALQYATVPEFTRLAATIGIMGDEKAGIPRTAYHGVVTVRQGRHTVFVYNPRGLPKEPGADGRWW